MLCQLDINAECHSENEIKPSNPIRCTECGYRIMYKKRTKRSILNPQCWGWGGLEAVLS